jgi:hypothetical protein
LKKYIYCKPNTLLVKSKNSIKMSTEQEINWALLLHIQTEGWEAPPINPNPLPRGISALHAITLASGGELNIPAIWTPPTIHQLELGEHVYWANRKKYAVFDQSATCAEICQALCQNRPLNYTELVLVVKCPFFAQHRKYAMDHQFAEFLIVDSTQRCENECICHFLH